MPIFEQLKGQSCLLVNLAGQRSPGMSKKLIYNETDLIRVMTFGNRHLPWLCGEDGNFIFYCTTTCTYTIMRYPFVLKSKQSRSWES